MTERNIAVAGATQTNSEPLSPAARRRRDTRRRTWVRAGIQLVFFFLAPSLFTSAFAGIKQVFTAVGHGEPLAMSGFIRTLLALCLFTVLFGRFFCGYACAFGALGDLVYFLGEKLRKKKGWKRREAPKLLLRLLGYFPWVLLTLIVLLCVRGVYGSLRGWSPWDVFSLISALNFHISGLVPGLILFLLILVGMGWQPRFFCRFLCPLGAVFRLMPILPWAVLRRDRENCVHGCSACGRNCPVALELDTGGNAGDCIRCGKCADICPKEQIRSGIHGLRGNEVWLSLSKAALLLVVAFLLGAVRI